MYCQNNKSAFTLIELSIVLVVIGLIVGGVLVGRDLINSSKLRAQVTQIEQIQTAVMTFKAKYGYLPGDMPGTGNGTDATDPNSPAGQLGFDTRGLWSSGCTSTRCGNNDGIIGSTAGAQNGEEHLFWLDLSQANLIGHSFTTYITGANTTTNIKDYLPPAKLADDLYLLVYSGGVISPQADGKNYLNLSKVIRFATAEQGRTRSNNGIKVIDAHNIDTKMDDGMPQSGTVQAFGNNWEGSTAWAGGNNDGTGDYFGSGFRATPLGDPREDAYSGDTTSCYHNNGITGPQKYAVSNNTELTNCNLSFRF